MSQNQERIATSEPRWMLRLTAVCAVGTVMMGAAACGSDRPEPSEAPVATLTQSQPVKPVETEVASVTEKDPASTFVSTPPDSFDLKEVTFGEAEKVFRDGDYGKAAAMFEAYAERMPENPWGPYMLGISAWRDGDHPRAEKALRRTLEVDPKHQKGLINLSRVLLEQRKASDALEFVLTVVELEPDLGEGWRVLGNAYAELGMGEAATEAYRKAIVLDPEDAWTINNLGLLKIQEGKFEEALAPLARATELRPHVATFQNNLGIALERSGYVWHAAEAFRAALDATTDHGKARTSLERVEKLIPDAEPEALELWELAATFAAEVSRWQANSDTGDEAEQTAVDH